MIVENSFLSIACPRSEVSNMTSGLFEDDLVRPPCPSVTIFDSVSPCHTKTNPTPCPPECLSPPFTPLRHLIRGFSSTPQTEPKMGSASVCPNRTDIGCFFIFAKSHEERHKKKKGEIFLRWCVTFCANLLKSMAIRVGSVCFGSGIAFTKSIP